jgi:hypothetical protein
VNRIWIRIGERVEGAVFVPAYETKAGLPLTDLAITRAKIAEHFAVVELFVKLCFHHQPAPKAIQTNKSKQP